MNGKSKIASAKGRYEQDKLLRQARLLIPRLEKLVPDTRWQHLVSGTRGALLRFTAATQSNPKQTLSAEEIRILARAVAHAYEILEKAASEIEPSP